MIRFACPTCGKRLKAPDATSGRKGSCHKCGQKLQVPTPLPVLLAADDQGDWDEDDWEEGDIICPNPNCGYQGSPQEQERGSTILLLVLMMVGLLPGLIYLALFCFGNRLVCPRCSAEIGRPW